MMLHSIVNFTSPNLAQGIKITSPASGQVESIEDQISSSQPLALMGQGVAIKVESSTIVSPIKGTVVEWIPSLGKVILQASNKLRFLLQLPFSYSEHNGLGITPHITENQVVEVNQPLMTLDIYKIQLIEKPIMLFFMLLDYKQIKSIDVFHKHVTAGEDAIFSLIPKPKKVPAPKKNTQAIQKQTKTQSK